MKKIIEKTVNVRKGKYGKYGVIKIESKSLEPYIGSTIIVEAKK